MKRAFRSGLLTAACCFCSAICVAQAAAAAAGPLLSFTLDFPGHEVPHYVIAVHADGSGSYDSGGSATVALAEVAGPASFQLPPAVVSAWFDLAKQARYFAGSPGEMKHVAYAGSKVLAWNDGAHPATSVQFSNTNVKPLLELSRQFQGLAVTLQLGQALGADARFHPMQADHDMDALTSALKDSIALQPAVIAPQLRQVAEDSAMIGKVRRQAEAILAKLPAPSQQP